jgi:dTDP-4-dehydrorhamnose reductase
MLVTALARARSANGRLLHDAVAPRTQSLGWFDERRTIGNVDVLSDSDLDRAMSVVKPDVVVNAVGIVKQRRDADNAAATIAVNALLPHRLADRCAAAGARLIQISTDCVFAGAKGSYTESDVPTGVILRPSKLLGEVDREGCLTVRTSMVGRRSAPRAGCWSGSLAPR